MPLNLDSEYPMQLISYFADESLELLPQQLEQRVNTFPSNQIYWKDLGGVMMPFLPYFSNCKNYGQYIYLYDVIENADYCDLVEPQDTYFINPYKFGDKPHSDSCNDGKSEKEFSFECIYDEIFDQEQQYQRWFELGKDVVMFYIGQKSIYMNYEMLAEPSDTVKLVEVLNKFIIPEGKIPTMAFLKLSYYQFDRYEKLLIKADLSLSDFLEPDEMQARGEKPIHYNLTITYHSMNHSELVNEFALSWDIYFILYLFIGLFSVAEVVVFYFYHYLVYRDGKKIRLQIRCYFVIFMPAFNGMHLAQLVLSVPIILTSVVMLGEFWDYMIPYESGCIEGENCRLSVFDLITNQLKLDSNDFLFQRKGRSGIALFVIGLYIMYYVSGLIVPPDQSNEGFLGKNEYPERKKKIPILKNNHKFNKKKKKIKSSKN